MTLQAKSAIPSQQPIRIPHRYTPRSYQLPVLRYFAQGGKRAVLVWHRRAGKDTTALNLTILKMLQRVGTYFHLFPTYNQGKKILWDGINADGMPFLDHFPSELVERKLEDELQIRLKNGSIWQVVGTDTFDRIVGPNPVGCVFSEYALQDPRGWNLIRPVLAENGGWALFCYTPRGHNHGYSAYQEARQDPAWFHQVLTVQETRRHDGAPVITGEAIEEERRHGMPPELIEQEFFCSFEAGLVGSYYGPQIELARKDGRLGRVPWEPIIEVGTAWDLGVGDATAIWFYQAVGREIRLIDYYENTGQGLEHYAKILREKPYVYAKAHIAPHDIEVQELGSGRTRRDQAASLGIRFRVLPQLPVDEGIAAVRKLFPRMWFDEQKCARGLECLAHYSKEWDDKHRAFKDRPLHDWASDGADAMRYLALGFLEPRQGPVISLKPPGYGWQQAGKPPQVVKYGRG